ncbi:MAG: lactate utilization protein [Gammaproteobacteria bacterium]|nr:MAG: lactate utilization protein [Gammaproteobacteria bacterium]
METTSRQFRQLSRHALEQATLQHSLDGVREIMPRIRAAALAERGDFDALCDRARDIRERTLRQLDSYLEAFERRVQAAGGTVHWAATGEEACRIVAQICRDAGAERLIKSKSMVTEEIELNAALERDGFTVTETDLGEYIIQLRGEKPSHILAPSLHVTLDEVAETFHQHHDIERSGPLTNATEMLAEARSIMRDKFLQADVGITGANFLVAETGAAVIVTNEGNADLTASLPDTHIVVTGIEKAVPTLDDVGVLLRVLARSAIGERLSNYTTFVHGPRRDGEASGPANYHVVLVDNGRSEMLGTEFQDMLRCIRCSACLNHCPVYTAIGGHAYGSVYSGPMGAVLTPAFAGLPAAAHLPNASTFCGRCEAVCPVRIPLPSLLRRWRQRELNARPVMDGQRFGLGLWRWLNHWPPAYSLAIRCAARVLRRLSVPGRGGQRWIRRLPLLGAAWTDCRDLPAPPGRTFQDEWRRRRS